jgi:hypothetical protein
MKYSVEKDLFLETVTIKASGHTVRANELNRGQKDYYYLVDDRVQGSECEESAVRWYGQEIIDTAKSELIKLLEVDIPKAIRRGQRSKAYKAMKREAKRYRWPSHYSSDMTYHDAKHLGINPPSTFVWVLRECGTWIIPDLSHTMYAFDRNKNGYSDRVYIWDGNNLTPTTPEEAQKYLRGF